MPRRQSVFFTKKDILDYMLRVYKRYGCKQQRDVPKCLDDTVKLEMSLKIVDVEQFRKWLVKTGRSRRNKLELEKRYGNFNDSNSE